MGSGYFPIKLNSKEADQLILARANLRKFREKYLDYIGEDGQFDNAASDGAYLERILIAIEMIDDCLDKSIEITLREN